MISTRETRRHSYPSCIMLHAHRLASFIQKLFFVFLGPYTITNGHRLEFSKSHRATHFDISSLHVSKCWTERCSPGAFIFYMYSNIIVVRYPTCPHLLSFMILSFYVFLQGPTQSSMDTDPSLQNLTMQTVSESESDISSLHLSKRSVSTVNSSVRRKRIARSLNPDEDIYSPPSSRPSSPFSPHLTNLSSYSRASGASVCSGGSVRSLDGPPSSFAASPQFSGNGYPPRFDRSHSHASGVSVASHHSRQSSLGANSPQYRGNGYARSCSRASGASMASHGGSHIASPIARPTPIRPGHRTNRSVGSVRSANAAPASPVGSMASPRAWPRPGGRGHQRSRSSGSLSGNVYVKVIDVTTKMFKPRANSRSSQSRISRAGSPFIEEGDCNEADEDTSTSSGEIVTV